MAKEINKRESIGKIEIEIFSRRHPMFGIVFDRVVSYNNEIVHSDTIRGGQFRTMDDELHRFWKRFDMEWINLSDKQCQCSCDCRNNRSKRLSFFRKLRLKFFG